MFEISIDYFALLYILLGFGLIFGLAAYYSLRDRNLYEAERSIVIFHCVKCGKIYSDKMGAETSHCPECGFNNGKLQF